MKPGEQFVRTIATSRIIVLLGAGGVGKTTTSIVVALLGARLGKRVALLSIDPAKRLAAALGIPLGNQLRRVEIAPEQIPPGLRDPRRPGGGFAGHLDAAMLDQKAVFDAMVRRSAKSAAVAAKILANPIYQAASANLAGPLEYMALAKLQDLADDPSYDLVVLDTPPDTHALDFLARPNVLAGFMENKVMSWLIKPFLMATRFGLGRLFSAGERLMGGIAKVTGVSALHSLGDFLLLMQEVIDGFHRSGQRIVELLRQDDTRFLLVTVPTLAAGRGAMNLFDQLSQLGYATDTLIFNRCLPPEVVAALTSATPPPLRPITSLEKRAFGERRVIEQLKHYFASHSSPLVVTVADQEAEIGNLSALLSLAAEVAEASN